ncbi:PREDICTED: chondroitin sulfate synthase 1 isoform X2 [Nicrophorus vespilloides]|uniref:Hexosyltransferase n=1 Tax=Nicrophorus vespilloides TaxID=110193 RepID=A0ABM1MRG8_NICVS|nr:PREDICTED: chondroitin sulfate synthase 1 isoform X2 [Nicrophorus vespilloides]
MAVLAARRKLFNVAFGLIVGLCLSQMLKKSGGGGGGSDDVCVETSRRPAAWATEDDEQDTQEKLLFVGVMTAAKYLDGRAKAVYDTWGSSVPGKIAFFSSEGSYSEHVPLIPLIGVDDTYPPQKKSFMMLKYMHDNYLEKFEWFMRADDDVYVRTDKLDRLLRSVDSRKPWFIGQTGRGNSEEFGLLSLESDENFCMGGPGVILSRETLRKIGPNIESCLSTLYTTHEDVELGRCVRRTAGISCTWSYEMQVIFYHNQSGNAAFTGDLKQKEVHRAITLHPIKKPKYMHRMHKYIKSLQLQAIKQESIRLHRDIASSMAERNVNLDQLGEAELYEDVRLFEEPSGSSSYLGEARVLGARNGLNRFRPTDVEDVLDWDFISKSLYSYKDSNSKRRLGSSIKEGLSDVIREVMEIINLYSKQRGRVIDFKEVFYGYWRLDPVHGVDLILDLLLVYRKYRGHKMTIPVRRHAYIQQTFTGLEIREMDTVGNASMAETEVPLHRKLIKQVISKLGDGIFSSNGASKKRITFVLPLSGRYETFKRFLQLYEDACVLELESTRLLVILYKSGDFDLSYDLLMKLRDRYRNSEILVDVVDDEVEFSRGRALQRGVNLTEPGDLLLFIDVDIVFSRESLRRIRQNTVRGRSVYFPIVYSTYKEPADWQDVFAPRENIKYVPNFDNSSGSWRQFGFGIVSLYKSDYETLGGLNLTISGWGYEDVNFFDAAIRGAGGLKVIRSADPGLLHVYHPVVCDRKLDSLQMTMCRGSQASTLASLKNIQEFIKTHKDFFRGIL